ncbi:MAG: VWA domain-containing protein [Verrucomicrobiae bacterium]|nr:VWA domain-containing protein [Verrucomicrobiae bacterium]
MTSVNFQFAHPELLFLLLLLPVIALLKGKAGGVASLRFPSVAAAREAGGKPRGRAGGWLAALRLLALAALIIGLARPQLGRGTTEVDASGIDILLAIDVSGSMEALDFELNGERANRLEVVKQVVKQFVDERPNDRIGIVAFAGRPYLVSPLTLDHEWLVKRLESVKIGQVEDGTAIGSAIVSASNHVRDLPAKSRIIILMTDGQNNAGKVPPLTAAEAAHALGIKVYTIGVGTRGQAPIPVTDAFGRTRYRMMEVDIDEDTLKQIAERTGGRYFRADSTDTLRKIYDEIDRMEKTEAEVKEYQRYRELMDLVVLPALFLLLVDVILNNTVWRRLP